jgi:hypothetical protein
MTVQRPRDPEPRFELRTTESNLQRPSETNSGRVLRDTQTIIQSTCLGAGCESDEREHTIAAVVRKGASTQNKAIAI